MKVKELKKLLIGVDDEMDVLIPTSAEFNGMFMRTCDADSGVTELAVGDDLSEEDIEEMELLNKELPTKNSFLLVPCGFFEEKCTKHELN